MLQLLYTMDKQHLIIIFLTLIILIEVIAMLTMKKEKFASCKLNADNKLVCK